MTAPSNQGLFLDVVQGGAISVPALFSTYIGSGVPLSVSGVTVTVTPAAGGAPILGPTSTGVSGVDSQWLFFWQPASGVAAGDYTIAFTPAAPAGTPPVNVTVTVVALPAHTPAPGLYATIAQYRARERDELTPDPTVEYYLEQATEVLDVALVGAVYATDANQLPTDANLIDVLVRATCAQVAFMVANNDPANVKSQYTSTNVGGVGLTRAPSATGLALPPLAPRAAAILRVAGVLPAAPLVNW